MNKFHENVFAEMRLLKSESSIWRLLLFGLLFMMFSFVTILLLVKSSGRFVSRFDRKSTEVQMKSNLVDKPVDLKLDELRKERGNESIRSISASNSTQLSSLSKPTIQSNQLDDQSTTGGGNRTEQTSNQTKSDERSFKKKVKHYDL